MLGANRPPGGEAPAPSALGNGHGHVGLSVGLDLLERQSPGLERCRTQTGTPPSHCMGLAGSQPVPHAVAQSSDPDLPASRTEGERWGLVEPSGWAGTSKELILRPRTWQVLRTAYDRGSVPQAQASAPKGPKPGWESMVCHFPAEGPSQGKDQWCCL